MSSRFVTNSVLTVGGGFLVAASLAFAPTVTAWLALAVSIGVLATSAVAQVDPSRTLVQRGLDGIAGIVAVVMLVFSVVFTGVAVHWLAFAFALGFVGLGYTGLVLNEVGDWRAEHGLAPLRGVRVVHGSHRDSYAA